MGIFRTGRFLAATVLFLAVIVAGLPSRAGTPAVPDGESSSLQAVPLSPGGVSGEVSSLGAREEYRRGREQLLSGRLEDAVSSFKRAADLDPLMKEAYFGAGCAEDARGNYPAAAASYEMALSLDPRDAAVLNNMGVSLFNSGRFEEAVLVLVKAAGISPSSDVYNNLGVTKQKLGRWDEARSSFDRSREISSNDTAPLYNMAAGSVQRGQDKEALSICSSLLEREPQNPGGHLLRGVVLFRQNKTREALDELRESVRLSPGSAEAVYNLGVALLAAGKKEEALDAFQRAVEIKPSLVEGHMALGRLLGDAGRYEEAQEEYLEALRLEPAREEIQVAMGNLLLRQGKLEEASGTYDRIIKMNPNNPSARNNLGVILRKQERPDEALLEFKAAVKADPSYAVAWYNMGYLLEAGEDRAGALKAFENFLRLAPGAAEAPEVKVKVQELRQ